MKDLCAIPHMDALIRAGVSSFKIEGRMKRPEYVAAAVTACRDMLSGKKPDLELLQDVFSREGFTDGYLTGKRTSVMFGHRTKENVLSFKNAAGKLKALYASEVQRIPISFTFQAKAGQAVLLNASDGVHSVSVSGTIPEAARTMSLMEENVQHAIVQTGGTPYSADIINVSVDSGISVPLSDIKHLRREALEQLDSLRGNIPKRSPINQTPFLLKRSDSFPDNPKIRIRLNDWSQYSDSFRDYQLQIPYGKILSNPSQMLSLNQELIAELPVYVFPDHESSFLEKLKELKKLGIRHVISGNIGVLRYAKDMGFLLHGDYALNIANSVSASSYSEMGLLDLVLSFEIPIANAKAIAAAIPSGVLAYGYLPLMHFRSCPNRDRRGCSSCNGKIHRILDGKQIPFYLGCNDRTYSVLYNGTPLYIGDSNLSGLDFLTLFFSKESDREAEEVFRLFLNGEKADFPRTKGLYYRELK